MSGLGRVVAGVRRVRVGVVGQLDASTRARRWGWFWEAFPDVGELTVVDLGGSEEFWRHAPVRPRRVVVVSGTEKPRRVLPWLEVAVGEPGEHVGAYDVAVCEGLPAADEGRLLAQSVRRLGRRYWVRSSAATGAQLGVWFPDAVVRRERRGGVTVSRIAAKPR